MVAYLNRVGITTMSDAESRGLSPARAERACGAQRGHSGVVVIQIEFSLENKKVEITRQGGRKSLASRYQRMRR